MTRELREKAGVSRRHALALLSSWTAAGLAGCSEPVEDIVPYVNMPERLVPGEPMRFATTLPLSGYGRGMTGICFDGRPVKIEGNPRHPCSLGATDIFAEAEVLSLYDPDRSRNPARQGQIASWREFSDEWLRWADQNKDGAGMVLLTGRVTSPTTLRMIALVKQRFPQCRHLRYEPVNDDAARAGAQQAFGQQVEAMPRLGDAATIVSLGADPLGPGPAQLRNARAFSERRRSGKPQRLYAVESGWTLSGAMADHRLPLRPENIGEVARHVAAALGADSGTAALSDSERAFAQAAAADLMQNGGIMLAGAGQSASVHALCHWVNGKVNAPVDYVASADPQTDDHGATFAGLLRDLEAKRIRTLVVLDSNPVYDSARPDAVGAFIAGVPFTVHCGLYRDETAEHCRWHLPLSHTLESWGDLRSVDGTASLIQPLIRLLYDTKTAPEILNILAGGAESSARDLTRQTWAQSASGDFETWWRQALSDGVIANTAPVSVSARAPMPLQAPQAAGDFTLILAPHPSLWDGRYANNAWLQECPEPFTKEVWGNAVHMSPEDATRLGISDHDSIFIRRGNIEQQVTVAILAGHAQGAVTARIGQGRWRAGVIGSAVGVDMRTLGTGLETLAAGVSIRPAGTSGSFATTQPFTELEGRDEDLYPIAPIAGIRKRLAQLEKPKRGIVPEQIPYEYAWAMVIDNDVCIGCNACVVACQGENNVGVVGPEEIAIGRDMHWLRVDAYEIDAPRAVRRGFQPVPCMHCETAPCEPVCPVEASVHDHEGINMQVYNRCIGTRFCQANCPYKVRRFNYFGYTRGQEYGNLGEDPVPALRNPNVSVRGRGVMEKCTYCVQRISAARKQSEKQDRPIADGDVVTACQAACPTRAIHFGNRNEASSQVAQLQNNDRHYALLGHLDTRPRTTYLARVFNPNATLEGAEG